MALIRTRGQLRDRAKREAQRLSDTGAYGDALWNASIADAWGKVWYQLTSSEEGYGEERRTLTALGGPTVDLPADIMHVSAVQRVSGGRSWTPELTSWREVSRLRLDDGVPAAMPGYYIIEGPGPSIVQRLRFWPDLAVGEQVRIGMIAQPPSLGSPSNPLDDTLQIDVIAEPIEQAIAAYARVVAAAREDLGELQRAGQALGQAVADFMRTYNRRNRFGASGLNRFRRGGGWVGY